MVKCHWEKQQHPCIESYRSGIYYTAIRYIRMNLPQITRGEIPSSILEPHCIIEFRGDKRPPEQSWTSERFTDAVLSNVEYLQFNGHTFLKMLADIFGWKILAHHPFQQPKSLIHNFLPQQKSPRSFPAASRQKSPAVSSLCFLRGLWLRYRLGRSRPEVREDIGGKGWGSQLIYNAAIWASKRGADSSITGQKEIHV